MAEKTISKIPLQSITVVRAGKLVTPELHKAFDFTESEIADIETMNPEAVRDPVDESAKATAPAKGKAKTDEGL